MWAFPTKPARLGIVLAIITVVVVRAKETAEAREKRVAAVLPDCAACAALAKAAEQVEAVGQEGPGKEICQQLERGQRQCRENVRAWQKLLAEWAGLEKLPPLREWLCENQLQVCCPPGHYGPDCRPCTGFDPEAADAKAAEAGVCSGRGRCKGQGTRKGNGQCDCRPGYAGQHCQQCGGGFYVSSSSSDSSPPTCVPCHKSCRSHCTGPGPKTCAACASGYQMDTEHGCQDLDECDVSEPCPASKFCVNTEGSFVCMKCDASCASCHGEGADKCNQCADGYVKRKRKKKDSQGNEVEDDFESCLPENTGKMFSFYNTRLFPYLGLFVAAAIVYQHSTALAAGLLAVLAVYVGISEYFLQDATGDLQPMNM